VSGLPQWPFRGLAGPPAGARPPSSSVGFSPGYRGGHGHQMVPHRPYGMANGPRNAAATGMAQNGGQGSFVGPMRAPNGPVGTRPPVRQPLRHPQPQRQPPPQSQRPRGHHQPANTGYLPSHVSHQRGPPQLFQQHQSASQLPLGQRQQPNIPETQSLPPHRHPTRSGGFSAMSPSHSRPSQFSLQETDRSRWPRPQTLPTRPLRVEKRPRLEEAIPNKESVTVTDTKTNFNAGSDTTSNATVEADQQAAEEEYDDTAEVLENITQEETVDVDSNVDDDEYFTEESFDLDQEDSDGPVIVSKEELLASLAREANVIRAPTQRPHSQHHSHPLGESLDIEKDDDDDDDRSAFLAWVRANTIKVPVQSNEDQQKKYIVDLNAEQVAPNDKKEPAKVITVEEVPEIDTTELESRKIFEASLPSKEIKDTDEQSPVVSTSTPTITTHAAVQTTTTFATTYTTTTTTTTTTSPTSTSTMTTTVETTPVATTPFSADTSKEVNDNLERDEESSSSAFVDIKVLNKDEDEAHDSSDTKALSSSFPSSSSSSPSSSDTSSQITFIETIKRPPQEDRLTPMMEEDRVVKRIR
jgi:hypothetical protein